MFGEDYQNLVGSFIQEMFDMYMPTVSVYTKAVSASNVFDEPVSVAESLRQIKAFYRLEPSGKLLDKFGIAEEADLLIVSKERIDVGEEAEISGIRYEITSVKEVGWFANIGQSYLYAATGKRLKYD